MLWIVGFFQLVSLIDCSDAECCIPCIFLHAFKPLPIFAIFPVVAKCFAVANIPLILNVKIIELFNRTNNLFVADELLFEIESYTELGAWSVVQVIV